MTSSVSLFDYVAIKDDTTAQHNTGSRKRVLLERIPV